MAKNTKVLITWNGQGGELDSVSLTDNGRDERKIANALVNLIGNGIVNPGDSFTVEEVE